MEEGATEELAASGAKIAAADRPDAHSINWATSQSILPARHSENRSTRVKETVMDRVSALLGLEKSGLGCRIQCTPDESCG